MIKLKEDIASLLDKLIDSEIEIVEKAFDNSETLGKIHLSNSITSFKKDFLEKLYGPMIPALSTEYRYFILGLLSKINDKHREIVTKEILIPSIGEIETNKLLECLNNHY